jgi:uncharacterized protein
LYLAPVGDYGKKPTGDWDLMEIREFEEFAREIRAKSINRGIHARFAEICKDDYVCYAAMPNSYVFTAQGTVEKCTVCLHKGKNVVGQLEKDGTIKFNGNEKEWLKIALTGSSADLSCPARRVCAKTKMEELSS